MLVGRLNLLTSLQIVPPADDHEEHQCSNVVLGGEYQWYQAQLCLALEWVACIVIAEELCYLQGSDTQALIVVFLLHISQTKLNECTWPFTRSLFSLALLHSSSSTLFSSSACGLTLTTCRHYCWIALYLDYNWMKFHILETIQLCFSPICQNKSWYYLGQWVGYPSLLDTPYLSTNMAPSHHHPVWAFTLLYCFTMLILINIWLRGIKNKSQIRQGLV